MFSRPIGGYRRLAYGAMAAGATFDLSLAAYTGYRNKVLVVDSWMPSAGAVTPQMRTSSDGGATFDAAASDYQSAIVGLNSAAGAQNTSSNGGSTMLLAGFTLSTTWGLGGLVIEMFNSPAAKRGEFFVRACGFNSTGSAYCFAVGTVMRNADADVNALRLYFSAGNIVSGNYVLYGW